MPSPEASELPLEIDVHSVKQLIDTHADFLLLDCRESDEVATAQIEGASWIPMNELPNRVQELDADQGRRIVVHCHGGVRSLRVAHWLRQQGFAMAQSMAGGIDAWSLSIDSQVPRY